MLSRRQLLASLGAGTALPGCVADRRTPADDGAETTVAGPDDTPGSGSTATDGTPVTARGTGTGGETPRVLAGECEATTPEWTDPARQRVSPKPLPEGPPEMTADAVASYVEAYERAYLYNDVLERDTERVGVTTADRSVDERPYGFVVTLQSWYYHDVRGIDRNATGTNTRVHADAPHVWRRYLVTDSRLVRATGTYDRPPDVARGGTVVECWDG
jgi:hypothetical protein